MEKNQIVESLVTMRCLGLFFYNFTSENIDELRKDSSFNHVWTEYLDVPGISIIEHTKFFDVFYSKLSYKTQSLIIKEAFRLYEEEARRGISFSFDLEKLIKNKKNS